MTTARFSFLKDVLTVSNIFSIFIRAEVCLRQVIHARFHRMGIYSVKSESQTID